MPTLFGSETEYAFGVEDSQASAIQRSDASCVITRKEVMIAKLLQKAQKRKSIRHGRIWLENGGCLYQDCGHPEYCTPECVTPSEIVKHIAAGDFILKQLCEEISTNNQSAHAFRINYEPNGLLTWGCHESYLCKLGEVPNELRRRHLPAFLATRIVYTGSGGMRGNSFRISPRARHMENVISGDTTCDRGLVNTKEEPHSKSYGRLHLICGEPLCSHLSNYLKFGVTAIVVAMVDVGIAPEIKFRNYDETDVIKRVAKDIRLKEKFPTNQRMMTAIEIQREYLNLALANLDEDFMPEWAPWVCKKWRSVLDKLEEGGWEAVSDSIDWAIKRKIMEQYKKANRGNYSHIELCEIDMKFGMIGGGIFEALDSAGVLNHRIVSDEQIEQATTTPPAKTRANIRGNFIREYADRVRTSEFFRNRGVVSWNVVGTRDDYGGCRGQECHQLNDPFEYDRKINIIDKGSKVVLGKHTNVDGYTSWHDAMDEYVGRVATIVRIWPHDSAGCVTARVDIDKGVHEWRIQNMRLTEIA